MAIRLFKSSTKSQNFVGPCTPTLEYVVVAGGGGGAGYYSSGGGGAGGYRSSVQGEMSGGGVSAEPLFKVTPGVTYSIIVGAGGRGVLGDDVADTVENGGNSSFDSIISIGGGAAGCNQAGAGLPANGGSGGGQRNPENNAPGGLGTAGQGYNAGGSVGTNSYLGPNFPGSGGGGAGGSSANVTTTTTGTNGGIGVQSSITGTPTYYAGGGGGSAQGGGVSGSGGLGGGGNAGNGSAEKGYPGDPGVTGTGGGGGAGNRAVGGNGGSGVVILRYSSAYPPAKSFTGKPIITNVGGYRIYKFLGNGSITF